jgi:hypothetical protein
MRPAADPALKGLGYGKMMPFVCRNTPTNSPVT